MSQPRFTADSDGKMKLRGILNIVEVLHTDAECAGPILLDIHRDTDIVKRNEVMGSILTVLDSQGISDWAQFCVPWSTLPASIIDILLDGPFCGIPLAEFPTLHTSPVSLIYRRDN